MIDTLKVILISLVISVAVLFLLGPAMLRLQGPDDLATAVTVASASAPPPSKPSIPQQMATPNIEGLSVRAARDRWAKEGIMIIEEGERSDTSAKPGIILEQIPTGGAPLRQKEIRVIVAKSPEMVVMPDVLGQTVDAARNLLLAAGFEVPPAALKDSDKPGGTVISQVPNANARSAKGSIARLVVSEATAQVPKVTGKRYSQARRILKKAGLQVGDVTKREHPELSGGRVLRQTPEAGTKLAVQSPVDLVVVAPD